MCAPGDQGVPYLRGYGTTQFRSSETFRNGQQPVVALDIIALMDALKIDRAIIGGFDWERGVPTSWRLWGQHGRECIDSGDAAHFRYAWLHEVDSSCGHVDRNAELAF